MNPRIAKLWVEALRSGHYRQGRGALRSATNEFCCLGILCNLHAQAHPEIAKTQTSRRVYLGGSTYPVETVAKWAGLRYHRGCFYAANGDVKCLAEMNDSDKTFLEIAAVIEQNVDQL